MKSKTKRILIIFSVLLIVLTGIVHADEENNENEETPQEQAVTTTETEEKNLPKVKTEVVKGEVVEAGEPYDKEEGGMTQRVQEVTVKILSGDRKNERIKATYVLSLDIDNKIMAYELDKGNVVNVQITQKEGEGAPTVIVQDVVRQNYLIYLVIFFFASILLVGRKKGIKAIIGLLITVLAIYFILILTIYKGYNAILLSIVTSFVIILLTFTVLDGWNKKTISAALGTLGGVVFAGFIAFIIGHIAKLSGASETSIMLSVAAKDKTFNFRDLLFAGIVIAALGACMDVGMSIASSLAELKDKKNDITAKELFKSGMRIGGDMIGTMTNTLILSFIGTSLNLVLLYMASDISFVEMINIEVITQEAVSAIAGSIGIVYTVPITAAIFAFINRNKDKYKTKSENIVDGKRSLKL
ncbi:MAG: YibE/F family protein [Clostridia bacterium]|nr:YibE/F family protein [Clostridia bacterium]